MRFVVLFLSFYSIISVHPVKAAEVYRENHPVFSLPDVVVGLTDLRTLATEANAKNIDDRWHKTAVKSHPTLKKLTDYIKSRAELLGSEKSPHLDFILGQVIPGKNGQPHYVRLKQIISRKNGTHFPIIGAEITAEVSPAGKLLSLNSSLVPTPVFSKEGFLNFAQIIGNSSAEKKKDFYEAVAAQPTMEFKKWVETVTRLAPSTAKPVPQNFLADPLAYITANPENMADFFQKLSYRALFRMIAMLKDRGELQYLVQRNLPAEKRPASGESHAFYWRFAHPFGSPATVDIEESAGGYRIARVFKNLTTDLSNVNIKAYKAGRKFPESGLFSPAESHEFTINARQKRSGDSDADLAANNLVDVVNFYDNMFNWKSYDNRGADIKLTVEVRHKALAQNAAWAKAPYNQFIFGKGGELLDNFITARDVIGHEFCHAVISSTSNLAMDNQPGAIDEHACDIMGLGFEAEGSHHGMIDFQVGEGVLTDISRRGGVTSLRHLLHPERSLDDKAGRSQPKTLAEAQKPYGKYCYATLENDHCGRHFQMGVLNYAVGQALNDTQHLRAEEAGANSWQRLRRTFFNTYTKRLRPNSDFQAYRTQLVKECRRQSQAKTYPYPIEADCQALADRFEQAGIKEEGHLDIDDNLAKTLRDSCKLLKELSKDGKSNVPDFCNSI